MHPENDTFRTTETTNIINHIMGARARRNHVVNLEYWDASSLFLLRAVV
jgi:hypothetical protein